MHTDDTVIQTMPVDVDNLYKRKVEKSRII